MSNELLWYISRATGITSIVLLTIVVILGVVTSSRRAPGRNSPTIVMALHRWLSLGMSTFLAAHIVTAIAETFVSIDWISAVVPFTSGFSPFWVGLGTLSVDLFAVVLATSYARHRMPERWWKSIHLISYAFWPLAIFHGFALGTADQPILRMITAGCGAVGAGVIVWSVLTTHHDRQRRDAVEAQVWS